MPRVVVTGLGVTTPLGNDVQTLWAALLAGRSGIAPIEAFDPSGLKARFAGMVRDFDADAEIGRREARRMDRYCQFAVAAALRAMEHAGLELGADAGERAAVCIGSGVGGLQTLLEGHRTLLERGPDRVSPTLVPMLMANSAGAQVSIHFGIRGRVLTPVSACATGTDAIGEGFRLIRRGEADVVVAGGAEAAVTGITMAAFGNAMALSTRNDAPERASRPFDAERDGFVVAEGAGIVVLESQEHARRRGARILAEVAGYGATSDAHHIVHPEPEGAGASAAMRQALEDAGIGPEAVDCVSAHATSTVAGDLAETRAIKQVFGTRAYRLPISAIKSMLGHMLGAAGAVAAIALVRALNEGIVPPTINLEHPDPECDLDYVPGSPREVGGLRIGLSNSFGFGGHNAVLVLRRVDPGE
jgi:3-oxoacyl-[acyl-carrier-protein] synthase II